MKFLSASIALIFALFSVGCDGKSEEGSAEAKIQLHEAAGQTGLLGLTNAEAFALVTSDEVLELVAGQYDFRELWKVNRDEVVLRLREATGVTVTSSLLSVSISLETEELSKTVTNLVAKSLCEVVAENDREARDQRRAILEAELEEYRDRHQEARKDFTVVVQQDGVPPMREQLGRMMSSEEEEYARAHECRRHWEDRKELLQKRCGMLKATEQVESTPLGAALLGSLEEELSGLQDRLDEQLRIVNGGGTVPVEPAVRWVNFRELEKGLERAEVNLLAVEQSQRGERRRLGAPFRTAVVLSKAR